MFSKDELTNDLTTVNSELQEFEVLYEMTSDRFYELWMADKLSDTFTFNAWAILVESRNNLRQMIEEGGNP